MPLPQQLPTNLISLLIGLRRRLIILQILKLCCDIIERYDEKLRQLLPSFPACTYPFLLKLEAGDRGMGEF